MSDSTTNGRAKVDLRQAARRKPVLHDGLRVDRLPPNSSESGGAEQGVLGCILLSPNDCLGQCVEKFHDGKEVFYDLRHQTIYEAVVQMYDKREPIDVITLQQRLKDRGLLDQIGGIPYLNTLQDSVPSAANLSYYLDMVEEKHLLRKLIHTCTDVVGRVYRYDGEVDELLDEVERDVMRISAERNRVNSEDIRHLVHGSIARIEEMFERKGSIGGMATGLVDLDQATDGMHPGEMVVLAGYPSTGKTSLAMNIVEHVVLRLGLPVAVFSHEMTPESLVTRMLASVARVNLREIKRGYMSESDFPKLTSAAGQLTKSHLHVVNSSGMSVGQIRAKGRRLHQQHGIKLFVVDYLQKAADADTSTEKRSDAVAKASDGFKALAMELNVPGLVLSQLNNEGGLFMSSETGMDADGLWKLRVDKSSKEWNGTGGVPTALDIEKQRNGPTCTVNLVFVRNITRFECAAPVADEDLPAQ